MVTITPSVGHRCRLLEAYRAGRVRRAVRRHPTCAGIGEAVDVVEAVDVEGSLRRGLLLALAASALAVAAVVEVTAALLDTGVGGALLVTLAVWAVTTALVSLVVRP